MTLGSGTSIVTDGAIGDDRDGMHCENEEQTFFPHKHNYCLPPRMCISEYVSTTETLPENNALIVSCQGDKLNGRILSG